MDVDAPWAVVPLASGHTIFQALQGWFYGPSTPAELARGDMAMDDNFAENAVCVPMDPITGEARMDVTRICPWIERYFLFYSLREGTDVVHVWGGLPIQVLLPLVYRTGGLVRRNEDLLWRPAQETRCRSMLMRFAMDLPEEDGAATTALDAWKPHYFFFPLLNATFQDAQENARAISGYVFDVFFKRLESYTHPLYASVPFPAGSTLEERLLDKGSFLLCANLTRELYPPEAALTYERTRMERERILYWNRWTPFLAPDAGELPLLGLLQYNTGLWRWLIERITTPTPEDGQAWFCTYPGKVMPTIWFSLPCQQIPFSLKEVRAHFPLHPGGLIHVPADAAWISAWIWDALIVPEAQRRFAAPPIPKQSSMLHHLGMLEEAKSWARRAQYPTFNMTAAGGAAGGSVSLERPLLDDGGGLDIEELHRLRDVLPPCVRRTMDESFPRNHERREMIEIMRLGGLSLQTMHYFFEKLNKRFPKPKPETLQKRVQVEAIIEWWKAKKPEDSVIWCTSLVNKALDVGPGHGVLVCPYALGQGRVAADDRPQFAGRCREQCVANSGCAGPRRQAHWLPWATPSQALKEALERQQRQQQQQQQPETGQKEN